MVVAALACDLETLTDRVTVVRTEVLPDTLIDTDPLTASAKEAAVDPDEEVLSSTSVFDEGQLPVLVFHVAPRQAVAVKEPRTPLRVRL